MSDADLLAEVERITASEVASLLGLEARHRVATVVRTLEAENKQNRVGDELGGEEP